MLTTSITILVWGPSQYNKEKKGEKKREKEGGGGRGKERGEKEIGGREREKVYWLERKE